MGAGRQHILLLAAALAAGCAHHAPPAIVPHPTPALNWNEKASLSLDRIAPETKLKSPTTRPNAPPSIAALELYAKARDATLRGQSPTRNQLPSAGDLARPLPI